jgi:DNA-binding SARP family transcriptional activator
VTGRDWLSLRRRALSEGSAGGRPSTQVAGRAKYAGGGCSPATVERKALSATLRELLELGEYERLADLIRQVWRAGAAPPDEVGRQLHDSACWICETCSHEQAEAAWHREALAQIGRRERGLRRRLRTMIELIGTEPDWAGAGEERVAGVPVRGSEPSRRLAGEPGCAPGRADARPPVIAVHCLGPFQAYFNDRLIETWPNGRGKSIFKFLLMQRRQSIGKEILMELFWPNVDPDAARNRLNVAIYGLRQAFAEISRSHSVVLFRDDCYLLNPEVEIWVDYEAFMEHVAAARSLEGAGELALAKNEYRRAEALYQGEFLEEDRYEDWPAALRRNLRDEYLALLDRLSEHYFELEDYDACVTLCSKMLVVDACHEDPHQRLMRCWSRQGLPHLALRQYRAGREALARDLQIEPSDAMTELFERIRRREPV